MNQVLQKDLISFILDQINDYKDLLKCKLVCKQWKKIICEHPDAYWKRFVVQLYKEYADRENTEDVTVNWFEELKLCHATGGWKFSGKQ